MKEQIKAEDIRSFNRDSNIFAALMLAMIILPIPLMRFLRWVGIVIWAVLAVVTLCYSVRIERKKKEFDIQTYKEIIAFTEGKRLDEIQKNQEIGKRPYQRLLLVIATGIIAFLICLLMTFLLR